jgi:hypothetical protein
MRALPIATPPPRLRTKIAQLVTRQLAAAEPQLDVELAELVNVAYELRPSDVARLSER